MTRRGSERASPSPTRRDVGRSGITGRSCIAGIATTAAVFRIGTAIADAAIAARAVGLAAVAETIGRARVARRRSRRPVAAGAAGRETAGPRVAACAEWVDPRARVGLGARRALVLRPDDARREREASQRHRPE